MLPAVSLFKTKEDDFRVVRYQEKKTDKETQPWIHLI